ncbi:MAG: hypothetical protein M0D54_04575 [Hyphomonadaceae bacterium JAD_PAG50586_4]|nr:MAG: hypothetical protein M0D54_04575 [Hyphomonadaceae bacterium JAD_PAG50586_4]
MRTRACRWRRRAPGFGVLAAWAVSTGQLLRRYPATDAQAVLCQGERLSWSRDGASAVSIDDNEARIANLTTRESPLLLTGVVNVSADGSRLLSVNEDEDAFAVIDAVSGARLREWNMRAAGVPMAVSANGQVVATLARNGGWRLLSVHTGQEIATGYLTSVSRGPSLPDQELEAVRELNASTPSSISARFIDHDRQLLLSDSEAWWTIDVASGEEVDRQIYARSVGRGDAGVSAADTGDAFMVHLENSGTGVRMRRSQYGLVNLGEQARGTVTPDGRALYHDTGWMVRLMPFRGRAREIAQNFPAFASDHQAYPVRGGAALLIGEYGNLYVVDAAATRASAVLPGHEGQSIGAAFSGDGALVLSADENQVRLWRRDGREVWARAHPSRTGDTTAANWRSPSFSPDGERVLAASEGTVFVWTLSGALVRSFDNLGDILAVRFSPNGARILVVQTTKAAVLDARTGARIAEVGNDEVELRHFALSYQAGLLATTARHSEPARIWDANTGRLVRALDDVECTGAVQFSPDGRVLACTSRERVTFINVTDWSVLSTVPVRAESIVFSPDSELLAVFNNLGDFGVSLWSVRESRRVATLRGSFSHGAFTPDGRNLVSVDFAPRQAGPNLRIWDIERLSQPLDVLARDACSTMLGATLRRFTQAEINNDQLLIGTWPSRHRDICEGVPGVQALRAVQ